MKLGQTIHRLQHLWRLHCAELRQRMADERASIAKRDWDEKLHAIAVDRARLRVKLACRLCGLRLAPLRRDRSRGTCDQCMIELGFLPHTYERSCSMYSFRAGNRPGLRDEGGLPEPAHCEEFELPQYRVHVEPAIRPRADLPPRFSSVRKLLVLASRAERRGWFHLASECYSEAI